MKDNNNSSDTGDCVVVDIDTLVECPLCGGEISSKEMSDSCSKHISGHNVCTTCNSTLKSQYFGEGGGCLYCGDTKSTTVGNNTIVINTNHPNVSNNNVVIIRNANSRMCIISSDDCCLSVCILLILVMVLGIVYLVGNCAYLLGRLVVHQIQGEDHSHKSELSIHNAIWGMIGWTLIAFILYILLYIIDRCSSDHHHHRRRENIVHVTED